MAKKINNFFTFFFTIVGIILLAAALYLIWNQYNFVRDSLVAKGKVIQIIAHDSNRMNHRQSRYAPLVQFVTADNQIIQFEGDASFPPQYKLNQDVEIFYSPASPSSAKINTFFYMWFGPLALFILGFVFTLVGWRLIRLDILNPNMKAKLEKIGRQVEAKIVKVEAVEFSKNKTVKWRIYGTSQEADRAYSFLSQSIPFNPEAILKKFNITTLDVLVDPQNMKNYYVKIEKISKLQESL